MKKKYTIVIVLALVLVAGGFAYGVYVKGGAGESANFEVNQSGGEEKIKPPEDLSLSYENKEYNFSFNYPSGYSVSELPQTGEDGVDVGDTILVQKESGEGFQILITPFDEPTSVITEERVRADVPDLKLEEVQPILIGNDGQGIAFKSDNEFFGGSSREVWFVFRGNLYQISTYLKYDPLLQAVFGTWQFK